MRSRWLGRRDAISHDSWRIPWARGRRSPESRVDQSPSQGSDASWKGAEGSAKRSELKAQLGSRREERSGAEAPGAVRAKKSWICGRGGAERIVRSRVSGGCVRGYPWLEQRRRGLGEMTRGVGRRLGAGQGRRVQREKCNKEGGDRRGRSRSRAEERCCRE
ncbi:hypothetical protein CDL15_Pgr023828 [Punica granatum]|uniref:Uncharacterized protein n=1 Tax=Punica granatum TaxID=22663 RepID=A0A218VZC2_PUNGR|nr:hypothetical protein CDL15_Pgr023828 [Punica granatum]PKI58098.1 hypothetical protein CRG98_021525 [Punica granatum]